MLCENCTKGFKLDGTPAGAVLDEYHAYFKPANPDGPPTETAVIVLTDIFGLALNNPKILADEYSKALGVDAWVPDLFDGKPPVKEEELDEFMLAEPGQKTSLFHKLRHVGTVARHLPQLFAVRPGSGVADKRLETFVNKIKADKKYKRIGVIGFCFGGGLAIRVGASGLADSVIIAHPGTNTGISDISKIKVPNAWLCAEEDFTFSPAQRKAAEQHMASRKGKSNYVEYEFHDFEGTTHGFATRPALQYPKIKAAFETSVAATVAWFDKTVVKPAAATAEVPIKAAPAGVTSTTEAPAPTAMIAQKTEASAAAPAPAHVEAPSNSGVVAAGAMGGATITVDAEAHAPAANADSSAPADGAAVAADAGDAGGE